MSKTRHSPCVLDSGPAVKVCGGKAHVMTFLELIVCQVT